MNKNTVNGVTFMTFANLSALHVPHCFSTRAGGVSSGAFATLNLGLGRGDADADVDENFRRLTGAAGFSGRRLVRSGQVHGVNLGLANVGGAAKFDETDGLLTADSGVMLVTFYADCVPLFLYDPAKNAAALSHAGWRGTAAEIGRLTVERMTAEFGSDPADLYAGIGPCICADCFEVGNDVAELFTPKFAPFVTQRREKFHIDLQAVNRQILTDAGVPPPRIEVAEECTMSDETLFWSHRRDGALRGSMAAFLGVTDNV